MNTSSPFKQRPQLVGHLVGTKLIVWVLEIQGDTVNLYSFPGLIEQLMPDGTYYGTFGDNSRSERYFSPDDIGEFKAYIDAKSGDSHASVMLRPDHRYTRQEIIGALKSALTGAWHAYKKAAEEAANDAIIALDNFEPD